MTYSQGYGQQQQQRQLNPAYANDIRLQLYTNTRKQRAEDPDFKVKMQITFTALMELAAIVQSGQWQNDPIVEVNQQSGEPYFVLRGGANLNNQQANAGEVHTKVYVKPAEESRRRTLAARQAAAQYQQGGRQQPPPQQPPAGAYSQPGPTAAPAWQQQAPAAPAWQQQEVPPLTVAGQALPQQQPASAPAQWPPA